MRDTINTKRWGLLAFLVGVYFLASALTWISGRFVLPAIPTQEGPTKITLHHFRQPKEWGISPRHLPVFLDRVTQGKPGILASKWLYGGLLGTYLLLVVLVFLRLTQDGTRRETGSERDGGRKTGDGSVGLRSPPVPGPLQSSVSRPFLRRVVVWGIDFVAILAALPLAYALRFNLTAVFLEEYRAQFLTGFVVLVLVRLLLRHVCHLQRMMWRYTGILELRRLVMATTVGTLIAISVAAFVTRLEGMPRSVFILEWGIYLFLAAGARISYRMLWEIWGEREGRVSHRSMKPVIVIGAGVAGNALAKELAQNSNLGEYAVAFVDDDPTKRSREVLGVPVHGPIELLPQFIARFDTRRVYIALPSATSGQMRRIVRLCEEAGAEFRTLPSLGDIVSGRATLHQLRPVRLEDLLGREPITIDAGGISRWLRGKRVLVTGAAGSIGSELCRQLLGFGVSHLTLFDQSEFHLYLLQNGLWGMLTKVPHRCVIGSVTDQALVAEVLREERPQVIFHTAAYKHVHLMEENPRAALLNNVLGTFTVGEEALRAAVGYVVLISTDKAVHPTGVMGATKKLAEEICLGLGGRGATIFQVVRFGNVIGSSGSVVPLFERQLASGGPLTVTHPEATRFFMTIPEAVRLILQAVTMGRGGEISLLDMGEPVRILDLAEQMIRLAGREPYTEIPIQFVGLRPGERLHEELWHPDEQVMRTEHPKILRGESYTAIRQPESLLCKVQELLRLPADASALGPAIVALANQSYSGQKRVSSGTPGAKVVPFSRPKSEG